MKVNALEIRDLDYKIKGFALEQISFSIPKGMITGLIGRNGAGKTTLIKMMGGILDWDRGEILYDGIKYWEDEAGIRRKLGIVYDTLNFNESYTVKKFISKIAYYLKDFRFDYFKENVEQLSIPYDKKVKTFSMGMKKKLSILMVLASNPEILIMDEPVNGVDPYDRYQILDLIQEFAEEENHAVLFSTHITEDLDKIADRLVFLDYGRIVMEGEKDEILEQFRYVEIPVSVEFPGMEELIGRKNGTLAVSGLTKNSELWNREGIISRLPRVEEIAIHISEIHKKEGKSL